MENILILATHGDNKIFYQLKGDIEGLSYFSDELYPKVELKISGVDHEIKSDVLRKFAELITDLQKSKEKEEKAEIAAVKAKIEHYQKRADHFNELAEQELKKLEKLEKQ